MKSIRLIAALAAAVMSMSAIPAYAAEYGWESGVGTGRYIFEDGTYATGVIISIDGVVYRFDGLGNCMGAFTGIGTKNGVIHYYKDGVMFKDGWLELNGSTYYFDSDGAGAVGIVTIDGRQYNFGSDGRLNNSVRNFSVTADKKRIVLGNNEKLTFTFTAKSLSGTAYMGEICELQKYSDGKWYKVKPSGEYIVNDIAYMLGNVGEPVYYNESVNLDFTPEEYSNELTEGRYRIAQTVTLEGNHSISGNQKRLYCEFEIVEKAHLDTDKSSYDIMSTDIINISGYTGVTGEYYAEAEELYVYNTDSEKWEKIEPTDTKHKFPAHLNLVAGDSINSYLDLTRYSRTRLKSGKYRALVGDDAFCEFKLTNPYDAYAEQIKGSGKKEVRITLVNRSDSDITVNGYGQLMRLTGGKWKSITPAKELDTQVTVPAMYKWEITMKLTKFYASSDIKSGSYRMKFPTDSGGYVYAYFDFSEEDVKSSK